MPIRSFVALLIAATLLNADTLMLRNGSRIEGNFVNGDNRLVRFAVGNQVNNYDIGDIDTIRFSGNGGAPSQNLNYPPQAANFPPPQSQPPDGYSPSPANNQMGSLQLPAGTQVVVRLIDPVNSEQDGLGKTFRASVDQPVFLNGQAVIPRGSDAIASLIDAQKSGKIQGRTVLTLDLKNVTVNGRPYDLVTTGVAQASDSRGKRSTEVIGGTAALGAIIGAIAGGGKGAAIGAGSGAAVGTAGEVLTSGQKVKIPAETRLTFTLQNPLTL